MNMFFGVVQVYIKYEKWESRLCLSRNNDFKRVKKGR